MKKENFLFERKKPSIQRAADFSNYPRTNKYMFISLLWAKLKHEAEL